MDSPNPRASYEFDIAHVEKCSASFFEVNCFTERPRSRNNDPERFIRSVVRSAGELKSTAGRNDCWAQDHDRGPDRSCVKKAGVLLG